MADEVKVTRTVDSLSDDKLLGLIEDRIDYYYPEAYEALRVLRGRVAEAEIRGKRELLSEVRERAKALSVRNAQYSECVDEAVDEAWEKYGANHG